MALRGPRGEFQSPLHRGALCGCGCRGYAAQAESAFQSPLHRGALCGRRTAEGPPGTVRRFQSPLHRGALCGREGGLDESEGVESFSPLFIGVLSAASSTATWCVHSTKVSVPSSSGCSLRLVDHEQRPPHAISCFSPLFIGVLSAAQPLTYRARVPCACFSPLFIGVLSAASIACPPRPWKT